MSGGEAPRQGIRRLRDGAPEPAAGDPGQNGGARAGIPRRPGLRGRWSPGAAGVALVAALGACIPAPSPPSDPVVRRDSAGVEIVESRAPAWSAGEGWTVDSIPSLVLGSPPGAPPHEFFRVVDALTRSDGSFAVAEDGSSQRVKFFGPDGLFLGSLGEDGEAPGMFRRLESIQLLPGDSVLAFDVWLRRSTLIDPGGRYVRVIPTPLPPDRPLRHQRLLGGGVLVGVVQGRGSDAGAPGLYRGEYTLVRFPLGEGAAELFYDPTDPGDPGPTPEGSGAGETGSGPAGGVDTLLTFPGPEGFNFPDGDARPLFGRTGSLAVQGERIVYGWADALEVREVTPDGVPVRISRVPDFDLSLGPREIQAARDSFFPSGMAVPPQVARIPRELPAPATRGAYGALLMDARGVVWTVPPREPSERNLPVVSQLFAPDGVWLGSVRFPPRFRPLEIGEDRILGVMLDDLDVEQVVTLPLRRTTPGVPPTPG